MKVLNTMVVVRIVHFYDLEVNILKKQQGPSLALSGGRSSRIQDAYMQYRLPSHIMPSSYWCFLKKVLKSISIL